MSAGTCRAAALDAPQIVYFVAMPGAPDGFVFVKIGTTSALVGTRKRLSSLQTGSPHDLDLMGEIPEEYFGREGTEAFWHRVYRRFHHSREWFQFPDEEAAKLRMLLDDRKRRARKAEEIFLVSSMRRVEDNLRMSTGATRRATERGK